MKLLLSCAAAMICSTLAVSAQTSASITGGDPEPIERSTYTRSADRAVLTGSLLSRDPMQDSDLFISQIGDGNAANINVTNTGLQPNQVMVIQSPGLGVSALGAGNSATLALTGENNEFRLEQRGNSNEYVGDIRTNNLTQRVLQDGDFNLIEQRRSNPVDGANIELIQRGNDNELDAANFGGADAPSVRVTQTGGAKASVTVLPGN